jgi:hypothetical protein
VDETEVERPPGHEEALRHEVELAGGRFRDYHLILLARLELHQVLREGAPKSLRGRQVRSVDELALGLVPEEGLREPEQDGRQVEEEGVGAALGAVGLLLVHLGVEPHGVAQPRQHAGLGVRPQHLLDDVEERDLVVGQLVAEGGDDALHIGACPPVEVLELGGHGGVLRRHADVEEHAQRRVLLVGQPVPLQLRRPGEPREHAPRRHQHALGGQQEVGHALRQRLGRDPGGQGQQLQRLHVLHHTRLRHHLAGGQRRDQVRVDRSE